MSVEQVAAEEGKCAALDCSAASLTRSLRIIVLTSLANGYKSGLFTVDYARVEPTDAQFKNALITPLTGFGDKAFVVEAVTDPKTNYKSALIVFYKGRVGGTVSAWKKPESSLETTKAVLRHILSKLP